MREREYVSDAGDPHQFKVLIWTSVHVGMRIKHDRMSAVSSLMCYACAFRASQRNNFVSVAVQGVQMGYLSQKTDNYKREE